MRVLVTGASGFLGSHVVERLNAEGHEVHALVRPGRGRPHLERAGARLHEGDLCDEPSLRRALRGQEGLVHCAGRMGNWSRIAAEQRRVNVEGSAALYRAAYDAEVARIVHVSSVGAVGFDVVPRVLDERESFNPRALAIPYVVTKHEAEQRALAAAWAGMHVVVVNPGALLGPRLDDRPPSALFVRIARGATFWVPPGGATFCDVADVAAGTVQALSLGRSGERYILGGHNLPWSELYARIAALLGVRAPRARVPRAALPCLRLGATLLDAVRLSRPPWAPEVFRSWGKYVFVDSRKAMRELGYAIRPLEEILVRAAGPLLAAPISSARSRAGAEPTPDRPGSGP